MATFADYVSGGGGSVATSSEVETSDTKYWTLERLKRAYLDYIGGKRDEIDEQQDSRRFRHGSHWTADQVRQLNLRRQPVVHENIVGRKVHGIVGTVQRLKQDPKAYPRTPKHEQGAELATAALRYVCDEQGWDAKDPICAEYAAVDGIGGIEINLTKGDQGDPEIEIEVVTIDDFFYDPRSRKHDFSDARYMGVGKWLDYDQARDMFPDKVDDLDNARNNDYYLSTNSDYDNKTWFRTTEKGNDEVRIVECWYIMRGEWCYSLFTGNVILMEGKSYLKDEKNKSVNKYEMFSAYVDQDGDRYGIVRDLKPLNVEANMRRSKALYTMLARRMKAEVGAFDDVELARREATRNDGVVLYNKGFEVDFDDTARLAETEAQFKFYESVKTALENFGPNIAVTGQGLESSSGRAINLLQQAGLADLGPYLQSYRGWKIRVYRKLWNAIQGHWTGERWIRVTDDDDVSQFIQINGVGIDPKTGYPTMVNHIGSLDVDIILDEGPDEVNAMGDAYDTLQLLAGKTAAIPPELAKTWLEIMLELSPLPYSTKKRVTDMLNPQPTPESQQQDQLKQRGAIAQVMDTEAAGRLKQAQAVKTAMEAHMVAPEQPQAPQPQEHPAVTQATVFDKLASAAQKHAQAQKTQVDTVLEPHYLAIEAAKAQQAARTAQLKAMQPPKTGT